MVTCMEVKHLEKCHANASNDTPPTSQIQTSKPSIHALDLKLLGTTPQQLFVASIFALLCMCKPAGLFASLVMGYGKPFHHGVMHIEVRHMAACNWVLKWWPPLPTWTWRFPSACTLFWGLQCSLPSMVCSWTGLFWYGLIQSRLIHRIYCLKCLEHRWATMMSSSKSQDGYSKIVHKADCDKLKGLHKRKNVDHREHFGFI